MTTEIFYFDGTDPVINQLLGDGDAIIYIDPDGMPTAEPFVKGRWQPVMIMRVAGNYIIDTRRDGDLNIAIRLGRPSFDTVAAARSVFQPMGYGTAASWSTLMEWAAACLP